MTPDSKPDREPAAVPANVHAAVARTERFLEHRLWSPAYDSAVGALEALARLGLDSAHVRWLAAVAADSMGRIGDGVLQIARARALDPVHPRAVASENIILEHVVRMLGTVGPDDAEVQSVLGTVRCHYSSEHPGLQRIDDTIAELAARSSVETERRPQA